MKQQPHRSPRRAKLGRRLLSMLCAGAMAASMLLPATVQAAPAAAPQLNNLILDRVYELEPVGGYPEGAHPNDTGFAPYPDLLAENGYTCAPAGKWHLGDSAHPQHGFSHWYTIGRGGCLYNQADVIEDGKLHFETRYITDLITERALDYLDECAGAAGG